MGPDKMKRCSQHDFTAAFKGKAKNPGTDRRKGDIFKF